MILDIPLEQSNIQHIKLIVLEYEQRITESERFFESLENKAKWSLGISVTATAGLLGYFHSNLNGIEILEMFAFLLLASILITCTFFAMLAFGVQEYRGAAVTPKNLQLEDWTRFINGNNARLREFYIMKINQMSMSIRANEDSNASKAKWLRRTTYSALLVLLLVMLFSIILVCRSLPSAC